MSIRLAIVMPGSAMVIVEIPVENVPGATDPEDAAVRVADWARAQNKSHGVSTVTRKANRVRIDCVKT